MKQVQFFAAGPDDAELLRHLEHCGYHVFPAKADSSGDSSGVEALPEECPMWVVSDVDRSRFKVKPNGTYATASQGCVDLCRSYRSGAYLVAGSVMCPDKLSDDAEKRADKLFRTIKKWITKSWAKCESDGYYSGPGIEHLLSEGVTLAYLPPDVQVDEVEP